MNECISNALHGFTSEEMEIIIAMLAAYHLSGTETTYVAFVHELLAQVHDDVPIKYLDTIVKGMNRLKPQKIDFGPRLPGTNLNLDIIFTGPGYDRRSTDMDDVFTGDGVMRSTESGYEQGEEIETT